MPLNRLTPAALLARVTGLAATAVGILVLAGWHLKIPAIIQIHPQFVPMQYDTALAFLFAGIGLFLLAGYVVSFLAPGYFTLAFKKHVVILVANTHG